MGLFKQWEKSPSGMLFKSQLVLSVPVLKNFWMKLELTRFCSTLGLLLKGGVPIVRAIQLAIPVVSNEYLRKHLLKCQEDLVAGKSFGGSLRESTLVPAMVGHMVAVGEETGSLSDTLRDIVENYAQETDEAIKMITSLLEPLMILAIGTVIGFIVVAMLLPIFALDMFAR